VFLSEFLSKAAAQKQLEGKVSGNFVHKKKKIWKTHGRFLPGHNFWGPPPWKD
jgi:hypothetical protein